MHVHGLNGGDDPHAALVAAEQAVRKARKHCVDIRAAEKQLRAATIAALRAEVEGEKHGPGWGRFEGVKS